MPPSHKDYSRLLAEPVVVSSLFHCGQFRDIDARRGVNSLTRMYRVEPWIEGFIYVGRNLDTNEWTVNASSFGSDPEGSPLICSSDLNAIVRPTRSWHEMEVALAIYFNAPIYEFRSKAKYQRKLKVEPPVGGD